MGGRIALALTPKNRWLRFPLEVGGLKQIPRPTVPSRRRSAYARHDED